MEPRGLPMFSNEALVVLDQLACDAAARGEFEWLSGGLMWHDEFPPLGTPERQAMSHAGAVGCLLAARAAVTLGQESGFLPVWEQVAQHAPNWPGLRPERRGETARRRLRAAIRRQDRCFAAIEAQVDANAKPAEPGAAADGPHL